MTKTLLLGIFVLFVLGDNLLSTFHRLNLSFWRFPLSYGYTFVDISTVSSVFTGGTWQDKFPFLCCNVLAGLIVSACFAWLSASYYRGLLYLYLLNLVDLTWNDRSHAWLIYELNLERQCLSCLSLPWYAVFWSRHQVCQATVISNISKM